MLVVGAIIAAAQAIAVVLSLLIIIGLGVALLRCPRELFGLIGLCLLVSLIQSQPLALASLIALMVVARLFHRAMDRPVDDSETPT